MKEEKIKKEHQEKFEKHDWQANYENDEEQLRTQRSHQLSHKDFSTSEGRSTRSTNSIKETMKMIQKKGEAKTEKSIEKGKNTHSPDRVTLDEEFIRQKQAMMKKNKDGRIMRERVEIREREEQQETVQIKYRSRDGPLMIDESSIPADAESVWYETTAGFKTKTKNLEAQSSELKFIRKT